MALQVQARENDTDRKRWTCSMKTSALTPNSSYFFFQDFNLETTMIASTWWPTKMRCSQLDLPKWNSCSNKRALHSFACKTPLWNSLACGAFCAHLSVRKHFHYDADVCMHTHMHTHILVHIYTCTRTHKHKHMHKYTYTAMVCTHLYTFDFHTTKKREQLATVQSSLWQQQKVTHQFKKNRKKASEVLRYQSIKSHFNANQSNRTSIPIPLW